MRYFEVHAVRRLEGVWLSELLYVCAVSPESALRLVSYAAPALTGPSLMEIDEETYEARKAQRTA